MLDPARVARPVSPTQLEAAADCAHRHFLQRGLGISAIDEREKDADTWLDPGTRGSELHALYAAMLRRNYIWMPAMVMHRRAVLAEIGGFDTAADHSGDFELHLRITRGYPVHYHGQTVAEYRLHGTQTSHKADLMLKKTLAVYRAQQEYIRGSRQRRKAYKEGLKFFRHLYGEQLVGNLRTQIRTAGERQRVGEGALLLLRHCPKVFMYHLYHKLYCTVFRIKEQEQS